MIPEPASRPEEPALPQAQEAPDLPEEPEADDLPGEPAEAEAPDLSEILPDGLWAGPFAAPAPERCVQWAWGQIP